MEMPGRDAPMQKIALWILVLLAADDELSVLNRYRQVVPRKPGDGERNPNIIFAGAFDIAWRIAVRRRLTDAIQSPFQLVKAE